MDDDQRFYCLYCQKRHGKMHAIFSYNTNFEPFIVIKDIGSKYDKSLTNDIEYALWVVHKHIPLMQNHYIVCRNNEGFYDEIFVNDDGTFKSFRSLGGERLLNKALEKCLFLHNGLLMKKTE